MDKKEFTKKLMDGTVSDKVVFRALLQYLKTVPAEDEEFSNFVASQRPAVWEKFTEYVTVGHKYCCGPNAIQDKDNFFVRTYKTILICCWRIKFYLKFGK